MSEELEEETPPTESVDPKTHPVDMPRIRVIATELKEPNIWLIRSVAAMIGMEARRPPAHIGRRFLPAGARADVGATAAQGLRAAT
jgi:hypothetical protein